MYQFISFFFRWCIGNLIFSSIWKEKCSLYFVRCLSLCAWNTLKLSFFFSRSDSFSRCCCLLPYLSSYLSLPPACSPCCFLFAVFCYCLFAAAASFAKMGSILWIFVSHVLLRFRTFFFIGLRCLFSLSLGPIVFFFSHSRHFHQTTWVYVAAMSISKHKKCSPRLRCKVETYQVIKSSMAFWGNAFIYIYKKKQRLLHCRLALACVFKLMPEVQSVFLSVYVCRRLDVVENMNKYLPNNMSMNHAKWHNAHTLVSPYLHIQWDIKIKWLC